MYVNLPLDTLGIRLRKEVIINVFIRYAIFHNLSHVTALVTLNKVVQFVNKFITVIITYECHGGTLNIEH